MPGKQRHLTDIEAVEFNRLPEFIDQRERWERQKGFRRADAKSFDSVIRNAVKPLQYAVV